MEVRAWDLRLGLSDGKTSMSSDELQKQMLLCPSTP